ncbi:MAG TPA: hypothetical protein VF610_00030 [Segetibacter sp.]|jgi:hypothetical protein
MEFSVSHLIGHFNYDETYEFFLFENNIEVLDEMLNYYIKIENYSACSALRTLYIEKSVRN